MGKIIDRRYNCTNKIYNDGRTLQQRFEPPMKSNRGYHHDHVQDENPYRKSDEPGLRDVS